MDNITITFLPSLWGSFNSEKNAHFFRISGLRKYGILGKATIFAPHIRN
jgi:hypothetical protein